MSVLTIVACVMNKCTFSITPLTLLLHTHSAHIYADVWVGRTYSGV